MPATMNPTLRQLLLSMNLGRSQDHPLAGWQLLSLLYHDGSTSGAPMTLGYVVTRYNAEYREADESEATDAVLKRVLKVLVEQARLVEETPRKVRERMRSGKFHIIQSFVYRINAAGIEYLKAMQRVIDAENTVVASTKRIGEYCALVQQFRHFEQMSVADMTMFDDFNRMLSAYDDVMNGLRKLDVDLHEIASDLAFDHGGQAAAHLQAMLHDQAIPAYRQMLAQAQVLQWLTQQAELGERVAQSRQTSENLAVNLAIGDEAALAAERQSTEAFVMRRVAVMAQSFDPSTSAIQASFDSMYLLFATLWDTVQLLASEFAHVKRQTVDIKALTKQIDALLPKAAHIVLPQALPKHLPMDRLDKAAMADVEALPKDEREAAIADLTTSVRQDMLEAGSMRPVLRALSDSTRAQVSEADNPPVADDPDLTAPDAQALAEFEQKVMVDAAHAQISGRLEFTTSAARNAVVALYPATQYDEPTSFAAFGRPVAAAAVLTDAAPVVVHVTGEDYVSWLPQGFSVTFVKEDDHE